jgi:hypothetical protein
MPQATINPQITEIRRAVAGCPTDGIVLRGSVMRIFAWTAAFAAMGIFVVACGTSTSSSASASSTSSGGDPETALINMYCHAIAAPFCEAEYACCSLPSLGWQRTIASCEADIFVASSTFCSVPWDRDALRAALRSGAVVFDHAQFEVCLTLLKSMVSGGAACVYPPEYLFWSTCIGSFQGQIAPGDACPWPAEGMPDDRPLPCNAGSCEHGICVPFIKTGDPCVPGPAPSDQPVNMRCNYRKHEGCWGILPDAGAGGGGGAGGAMPTGTCRPQAEIGEACDPGNHHECKSLYCNPTTAQCGPAIEGSPCAGY